MLMNQVPINVPSCESTTSVDPFIFQFTSNVIISPLELKGKV